MWKVYLWFQHSGKTVKRKENKSTDPFRLNPQIHLLDHILGSTVLVPEWEIRALWDKGRRKESPKCSCLDPKGSQPANASDLLKGLAEENEKNGRRVTP